MIPPSYLVRPEAAFLVSRQATFPSLSSARYFAKVWAYKSRVSIVIVDTQSGEPVERYSLSAGAPAARAPS